MELKHIPTVINHVTECLKHAYWLIEHEVIYQFDMQSRVPPDLAAEIHQDSISWDYDEDEGTEKFLSIYANQLYSTDVCNSVISKIEVNRFGLLRICFRDSTIIEIEDMCNTVCTVEGLFQYQTIHPMLDATVYDMRAIWQAYIDFHTNTWGEFCTL